MKFISLFISSSLLLTGCNLYKGYSSAVGMTVDSHHSNSTNLNPDTLQSLGFMPWRELFTDPWLQSLIEKGLQSNTNLQIAMLRIDEAKAGLSAAKLAFFPSLTLSPNGSIISVDGSKASKTYEIPLSLNWEIDLFGKLRNAKKEQQMQLLGQQAYAGVVQSELIASIAI